MVVPLLSMEVQKAPDFIKNIFFEDERIYFWVNYPFDNHKTKSYSSLIRSDHESDQIIYVVFNQVLKLFKYEYF